MLGTMVVVIVMVVVVFLLIITDLTIKVTVREHPVLGEFPSTREMKNFGTGGITQ